MKHLRKALRAIVVSILLSLTMQCSSSKSVIASQEKQTAFKVKTVSFQKWHAGENEESTGMNVFVPIVDKKDDVLIDSVYFRNFKGQLVRNYSRYTAVLKNNMPEYVFNQSEKEYDYPFTSNNNECVIKYIEKGKSKYLKVNDVIEKEPIHYKDGPPLSYQRRREAMIISEDSGLTAIPTFQPTTTFKVKTISFQEWYAGIKVGGTGMNVFVPIVNKEENIKIDSVYFRNLKAKLVEDSGRYTAVLKNKSPYYTFKKAEKDPDFPFTLKDNECAISFVENGVTKYVKVSDINEKQGVYYEDGPPQIYERKRKNNMIASNGKVVIQEFLNHLKDKRNVIAHLRV